MRHRGLLVGMVAATALMNLASARAAETTAVATEAPPTKVRVTALFVPAPAGTLHSATPGDDVSVGSQTAYGFATAFDFVPHRNAFVGFGANYTFNVQALGRMADSATAFESDVESRRPLSNRARVLGLWLRRTRVFVHARHAGGNLGAGAGHRRARGRALRRDAGLVPGRRARLPGRLPARDRDDMDIAYDASFFQTGIGLGVRI